jgi:hypothetical protein
MRTGTNEIDTGEDMTPEQLKKITEIINESMYSDAMKISQLEHLMKMTYLDGVLEGFKRIQKAMEGDSQ